MVDAKDLLANLPITGLTADSRDVRPGYLFAALPGSQVDGVAFIPQALDKGAIAVLAPPSVTEADLGGRAALIRDENPRRRFARLAARYFDRQPSVMVGVTGTNGKSSVVTFARQLWAHAGLKAASIGTLGIEGPGYEGGGGLTSPEPAALHAALAEMAGKGIDHAAIEVSSHGLDQHRVDGVRFQATAFTNLSRDHLDYHKTMEAYRAAKFRLFDELLPETGVAVLNAGSEEYPALADLCRGRGLSALSYGIRAGDIHCPKAETMGDGFELELSIHGERHKADLPLPGAFQVENILAALGLYVSTGGRAGIACENLSRLTGVRGRLQLAARTRHGARVYVDYAHTPGAMETVLKALRPHVSGRLCIVFGAGGDRDPGKRPMMGAVAKDFADFAIVTDDNPRTEEPAEIRRQVMAACPDAVDIGDRRLAIWEAMKQLKSGDVLVVAGKGHEPGQSIGGKVLPFDDVSEVEAALTDLERGGAA